MLLKKNKVEGSKKDYCKTNRTQKKKKKRMLSKLTAVISTEIQEQLEVFLPHHIYEERIKGWKEPSLSMPLPRGCAPGSPAVPAPCTDSRWGL